MMQLVKTTISRLSKLILLQLYLYFAPLMIYNVSDNLSVPELDSLGLLPIETPMTHVNPTIQQKTIDKNAKKAHIPSNF